MSRVLRACVFAIMLLPVFSHATSTSSGQAATLAELQAQIQALMARVEALKAQQENTAAPLSGAASSCPNLTKNLSRGSRGDDVRSLQQFLISQNLLASDSATGFFGSLTEAAVKQFQCKNMQLCSGSPARNGYGSVGPRTRSAIMMSCKGPSSAVPDSKPLPASIALPATPATPAMPIVLTKYPNFTNVCARRVVDYQNGTNVLSAAPAGCAWPNNPFLFSVTHESALNTHWRLAPDGTKMYDDNFVGDSAVYMHDYRDTDLGVILRHDFTPRAGENGANFLGMALDTINFPGTNVTGRDFRDGHLFMGLNDLSIPMPSLSKNVYVNLTFRIRGNDLVPYQGAASSHRLILGAKLTWPETGRTNTAHYFEFNLFKSPGFHAAQTQYPCPSDGLTYDYCFYDSSAAGLYAEGKYIPISSVSGYQSLSNITIDSWYTVRIPLSSLVKNASWFSSPQSWSSATLDSLYLGVESKGASRLWAEIKDYTVAEE